MLFNEGFLFLYSVGYKPPPFSNYRICRPNYIKCLVKTRLWYSTYNVLCQEVQ